jgi:hypothetical protein
VGVAQAVRHVAILRAMGLNISISTVSPLYLTKPQVGWVILLVQLCVYDGLVDEATDVLFQNLFQECCIGLLALPSSISFINVVGFGDTATGCDP